MWCVSAPIVHDASKYHVQVNFPLFAAAATARTMFANTSSQSESTYQSETVTSRHYYRNLILYTEKLLRDSGNEFFSECLTVASVASVTGTIEIEPK